MKTLLTILLCGLLVILPCYADTPDFRLEVPPSADFYQNSNRVRLKTSHRFQLSKQLDLEIGVKVRIDTGEDNQDFNVTVTFFTFTYRF